jgi:hypothetical protein
MTFTFREVTEAAEDLACRIRAILGSRQAMKIGELRLRLGADDRTVRAELEAMMRRGEVERLRPIDYAREDCDFFRIHRPAKVAAHPRSRERSGIAHGFHPHHIFLAGEAMACWAE